MNAGATANIEVRKSVLVQCWRGGEAVMNLGEHLCRLILDKLGYGIRYSPRDRYEEDEPALMMVGSDFHSMFLGQQLLELKASPRAIHVWGAGNGRGPAYAARDDPRVVVHAVRGPLTARWNACTECPHADPGFLVPWATGIERTPSLALQPVLYAPHWQERGWAVSPGALEKLGADEIFDVMMKPADVLPALTRLSRARFVLTGSLHVAICATAFGTPWALCVPGDRPSMPHKWRDVFASLGAGPPKPVNHFCDGLDWYRAESPNWQMPDLQAMLDAFPHFLAKN